MRFAASLRVGYRGVICGGGVGDGGAYLGYVLGRGGVLGYNIYACVLALWESKTKEKKTADNGNSVCMYSTTKY